MIHKIIAISVLTLSLSGCIALPALIAHEQKSVVYTTSNSPYNDKTQSRLRIYYQLANINMYTDTSCQVWKSKKVNNYFNSIATSLPNRETISIGMLKTESSISILNTPQKGWGPKNTFKEFVLDANKSIVLDARRVEATTSYSCQVAASFVPEAGQEYEAWYSESTNSCRVSIHKIDKSKNAEPYQTEVLNKVNSCI